MNILHKLTGRSPVDETALHYIWLSLACGFSSPAARELISAFHGADAVYDASDFPTAPISRNRYANALRTKILTKRAKYTRHAAAAARVYLHMKATCTLHA